MHAKLILSAIALLMASEMFADQLTPEEALARMNTTKSQSKGFATDKSSLQLTYTSTFKGNNTYYVFNKGNEEGYLILSADDCMPAVLGVVEGNSFDYDKLPDNMKWWLSQYDATISNYSAKGKKYVSSATKKKDIEPLLGDIKWDQLAPYNLLCPTVEGKKTPTGCVATAMAQVMGMWQWPKRGYGKSEYQWFTTTGIDEDGNYLDELVTVSRDFSKSRYEWGKIHSEYSFSGYEPEDEQLAIAQLMYDCGVATNMHYSFNGSGTELPYAVNALVNSMMMTYGRIWCMTISARECHWSVLVENFLRPMHMFAMAIWRMVIFSISTGDGEDTMTATSFSLQMMAECMMNVYIMVANKPFSI